MKKKSIKCSFIHSSFSPGILRDVTPVGFEVHTPEDLYAFCQKGEASGRFHCTLCPAFSHPGRHQVRNHIESRHFANAFQYSCHQCPKVLRSRKALEVHVSEKHRLPKF
jgi:hypothetical protein